MLKFTGDTFIVSPVNFNFYILIYFSGYKTT